jgi:hypothetical protein
LLEKLLLIEAASFIKNNLDWYLMNDFISNEAAQNLPNSLNEVIAEVGKYALQICEAFNIPKHMIYAPIYTGYREYYLVDKTDGEHWNLKPKF